ncbi:MAG: Ldh family oxidoreductase [Alphaproteobacteria bacterium]|nr:Ldh family oxidoreductase [Alphaproteobacteria bacterium]
MTNNGLRLRPAAARRLISSALLGAGAGQANIGYLTDAILDTELSGMDGHGFYWLQYYCAHVKSGKVNGRVRPSVKKLTPVSYRVDARGGFTHPAIEAGFKKLIPAAQKYGIAGMAVHNSYNAATLGFHTGYLAKAGLVAFGFTNAMPIVAPVGGRIPVLGTNPLSFAVPGRKGKLAFLIDQSSTVVPWTSVKRAAEEGRDIPLGWALDSQGNPTTDPHAGLLGSMVPAGGYKGFGIALMVEVMCAALAGALRGPEQASFTEQDGRTVGCGQFFFALEPKMFSGGAFDGQIKALVKSITDQKGARLPNAKREATAKILAREGIPIPTEIYDVLRSYAKK